MRQPCSESKKLKIKASMRSTKERRSRQRCRVFKVKIDYSHLSRRQRVQLKMMFVEAKWIKNDRIAWARDNNKSVFDCIRPRKHELVKVRNRYGEIEERELKHIGSQMAQGVVDEMKSNMKTIINLTKKGYQHGGSLKFVSEITSLNLVQYGSTYSFKSPRRMKIQGVHGLVRISGASQFLNDPSIELASAKLIKTPSGYYVSVSTFTEIEKLPRIPFNGKSIALDLGCSTTIAYSDGRKQSVSIGEDDRLKRLQRKFAKQQQGSNNRERTRRLIRAQYERLDNIKNDIANKIVAELKPYSAVVIQDEQLSKWKASGHGKAVQHSILGRLKSKLKMMDNTIILASDIPTTKICMRCGCIHERKLSDRSFECGCGEHGDRDTHAAQNMLAIAEMLAGHPLSVPVERREFKRVEFLKAYEKKFSRAYGTLKHEADALLGRR